MRNPVDRAYSHYCHWEREGIEQLSFEEAINKEPKRLEGELDRMRRDESYDSYNYGYYSYLARGIYVDQLIAWNRFFPRKQMLILNFEEFFSDPSKNIQQVFRFLNVAEQEIALNEKHNTGSYRDMPADMRKKLVDYYAPHNERLYQYLGTTYDWGK